MGRKSTSRPDTASTAAYSASQPLFDAIRNACDQIDEQKQHLTAAKDAVQKLHVQLPLEHTGNERVTRADYIEALVKSWRQATNSYQLIFAELCKLTAPDPATGRGEQDDYDAFKRIQETALNANTVSLRYVLGQPKPKPIEKRKASPTNDDESDTISPKSAKKAKRAADIEKQIKEATTTTLMPPPPPKRPAPEGSSPTPSAPRPVKRARTSEIDTTVTAKAAEPPTIAKRLNKRERRRQRNAEKANGTAKKEVPATLQPTTLPLPETETAPQQQVQYEDVSAEVAARLASKEEKKRAKKDAKKRKRDSLGSAVIEAEVGQERDALEARARELKEKPAKKRSKSATGEAVRAGEVELPERGKRSADTVDGGKGEGGKKRKKSKQ